MAASLFISDLHLSADRPDSTEALLGFLRTTATRADTLFILGDLFDYWIGDEMLDDPLPAQVAAALQRLGAGGTSVFFMHGNRDFLVGQRYAAAANMQLLPDPYKLDLYGVPTLLMHGDTLCTDDTDYQQFRKMVRNPAWQSEFLSKPLAERTKLAQAVRADSEQAKMGKSMQIMDVSIGAVESVLREHGYPRLVHGHTHRPATHEHVVDGHRCERIVLSDWFAGGSYLHCDASGCRAMPIE